MLAGCCPAAPHPSGVRRHRGSATWRRRSCLPLCTALGLLGPVPETNPIWHKGASAYGGSVVRARGWGFSVRAGAREVRSAMDELLLDYLPLVVFIAVALGISLVLLLVPFLVAYKAPDPEKLSAYECGFNAFDDARMKFDVRFYLVAILFIIFDLEMSFLFPWAVVLGDLGLYGYWSMMVFLGVLTVGFIYEWRKGALEWD